jgi:PAS domain S-box-containing protein
MWLLGVAVVAGNMANARQNELRRIVGVSEEIDRAILSNMRTDQVLHLILVKGIEFTNSTMGHIRLIDNETQESQIVASIGHPKGYAWEMRPLDDSYSRIVIRSKKSLIIPQIIKTDLRRRLATYFKLYRPRPKSALFVPLIYMDTVIGVIAVYSPRRFHYTKIEARTLEAFTPLIDLALKTTVARERHERLKLLNEIANELKLELSLPDLFKQVVDLTIRQLDSEEAALFIRDEENENRLNKVAVRGSNDDITGRLLEVETSYLSNESYIGRVFQAKQYLVESNVSSNVEYVDEYERLLPSGRVRHYLGVPLIIGDEVLGVIRVINKRAATYSEDGNFKLLESGFGEDDIELLQTIASQVASAIRSAKFVEVQRHYKELVENSPDPIVVLDENGRVKVFNKACEKIWGFSADEVKGQHVTNYYESESHAREVGELLAQTPGHRIHDCPARIKTRSGEIIPISLSASLLFDGQGKKVGSIGAFKDLREALRLQEEKTKDEKLATLGKLAHTVGHEIKHDIATALNYIDTLSYECTDDELSEIYRDVQGSLSEAVSKFQNLLMVGSPRPPEKQLTSAGVIVREMEPSLRRRADNRGIELLINCPDAGPEFEADVEQLKQVIYNLFDNSIDAILAKRFLDEKGRIELSAQAADGELRIIWRDNGCGFSTQSIQQVFTPFVTDKPTGNGLGLFLAKRIIENHGGRISLASEEGRGASFTIVLPLSQNAV